MPEPHPRSPAQIEAARRNGARSRGPVTPEGKARASRNALKHGLTALEHLVLDGEDAGELAGLTARLMGEIGPESEIEARLARRLAIAFWKGERAERMEVAVLDAAPATRMNGYQQVPADPLTTFDVRRFNAIRGQQAQLGREIRNCLKELRELRKDARAACTDEPEATFENEPKEPSRNEPGSPPPPANDDAVARDVSLRNEPGKPGEAEQEQLRQAEDDWTRTRLQRLLAEQADLDPWGPGGLLGDEAEEIEPTRAELLRRAEARAGRPRQAPAACPVVTPPGHARQG